MAGNDSLTRIGRGVPGANKPPERKVPASVMLTLAAAVLVVFLGLVVVVFFLDPPEPNIPPRAVVSAVDNRVECSSIAHEYESWKAGRERLETLRVADPEIAKLFLKQLLDEGDAFYRGAKGYPDAPSKALVLAVAGYNLELNFINIELTASNKVGEEHHTAALNAWSETEGKYQAFKSTTC